MVSQTASLSTVIYCTTSYLFFQVLQTVQETSRGYKEFGDMASSSNFGETCPLLIVYH